MSTEPIDGATFANLVEITGGEMDFVDELVDTYLAEGQAQIAALRAAVAAIAAGGDPGELVRPAHSLKSGSVNLGALGLGEMCRALEEQARSGTPDDAAGQGERIATAFEAVRSALLAERAARSGGAR